MSTVYQGTNEALTKIQSVRVCSLTIGVVCDLAVTRGANPGLHGRGGPAPQGAVEPSPFLRISEKRIRFEHVGRPSFIQVL